MSMRVLNLYCGIGGNSRYWSNEWDITAIDNNEDKKKSEVLMNLKLEICIMYRMGSKTIILRVYSA